MKQFFLLFAICCIAYSGYAQTYTRVTTVRTPNGSVVPYTGVLSSSDMPAMGVSQLVALNQELLTLYNGATMIGLPTYKYNCHAYAWHITEGGGNAWIGTGTMWEPAETAHHIYWTDGSYIEVPEGAATKIVYEGNHSAVRIDNNWYQSKWGQSALVKHHPNNVPVIYLPGSQKHYYLRNISVTDKPAYNLTETYSVPSDLPATVTFNGWTVTPSAYTTTSGLSNRTLAIKFSSFTTYTLKANFTLPDGSAFSATKSVNPIVLPPSLYVDSATGMTNWYGWVIWPTYGNIRITASNYPSTGGDV